MQWSGFLKTRRSETFQQVFDRVRRKWVAWTPEEMVRQLLIQYFIQVHQFPVSRMSVERQLHVHGMLRRYDLVLYDRNAAPLLLVECKAPAVPVAQNVLDQAARYNIELQVPFLLVTNGRQSHCVQIDFAQKQWKFLTEIPMLN